RLTTRSPMQISPEVMFSSPAIIRSRVDLPHPEGPTSTTNSPSSMRTSTPWMTSIAPKAFLTSRIATEAMELLPSRGPLRAPLRTAPAGSFRMHPKRARRNGGHDAGPAIGRDYTANCNSPLLTNAPDPHRKIPVSGAKFHGLDPSAAMVCHQPSRRAKYCKSSMPPLIRKATAEDAARIRAIARAAYAKYVPRMGREPAPMVADFAAEVAAGHVVVIATAGAVDGYMIAWPETDAYLIDNIAIDPARQGQGLGRWLMDHAVGE